MEPSMQVDPSSPTLGSAVTGAIRQAAQATGASFNYLLATAHVESGMNPQAGASTSSARGLFQFIQQTWLATMKQAGAALGYGGYAAAITQDASGSYQVQDPTMRGEILKLRDDPTANAAMAGAFTKSNAALLSEQLGRAPTEGELYIAHFLGAGGAARLITAAASNPDAKAADIFPSAAQANSSIFYDRAGTPRTVAQVRNIITARYEAARGGGAQSVAAAQPAAVPAAPAPAPAAAAAPDTAGIAAAFAAAMPQAAANDHHVFHGLFQDANRTSPVAPLVSALWTGPAAVPGGSGAPAPKPRFNGMLDLFKDPEQGS
jgi:hypothetical protein